MSNPKFILSKKMVLDQFDKVIAFCDIPSYSSKTNPLITPILENETDCMFSIHFQNELKNLKDKSRAIFLAQAWNISLIDELIKLGIQNYIVDNESDLDIMLDYLRSCELKIKINLTLRIKLRENTIRTEKYFVFGIKSDIVNKRILQISKDNDLMKNIDGLGVHFHRKTQNMSEWNLIYEISNMLSKEVLEVISSINIGGGLPSEYANTNINVLNSIFRKITELKEWMNNQGIKLIIEPGRFISAPAAKLVTSIVGIYENNIIVNASVYNSDMDAIIVPVKLLVEGELEKNEGTLYAIKGITPCSLDLFRYRVYLDEKKVGDELVFLNAGAYNFTSDFCDLDKIETKIVENF